jgi:hypothetical protein
MIQAGWRRGAKQPRAACFQNAAAQERSTAILAVGPQDGFAVAVPQALTAADMRVAASLDGRGQRPRLQLAATSLAN